MVFSVQVLVVGVSHSVTNEDKKMFKKPLWEIAHIDRPRDTRLSLIGAFTALKKGLLGKLASRNNAVVKSLFRQISIADIANFQSAYPTRARIMAARIKYELANKDVVSTFITFKHMELASNDKYYRFKPPSFIKVSRKAGKRGKLHLLTQYYVKHVREAVDRKIRVKRIEKNKRDSLVKNLLAEVKKAVVGTIYVSTNYRTKVATYVDRQFLNRLSYYKALKKTKSITISIRSVNSPPKLASIQRNLTKWRSNELKAVMDKLGISSDGKEVIAAKLKAKKKIDPAVLLVRNAKALGNYIGGQYKYTPLMERMHRAIAKAQPVIAQRQAFGIQKLLATKNDVKIKASGAHFLKGLRYTYSRILKSQRQSKSTKSAQRSLPGQRRLNNSNNNNRRRRTLHNITPAQKKQLEQYNRYIEKVRNDYKRNKK